MTINHPATPSWEDESLGTMRRAALWLVQVVGVGETFTKAQLRESFPNVAQIDRRMRDLRDYGWKIDTNREDVTLEAHEQRFVERGAAVWEPGKASRPQVAAITASQRHEILMRDGHKCRSCGIGPGETYEGIGITAQLDVARRPVRLADGRVETQLVIQCNRCRIGNRTFVADLRDVLERVAKLPAMEKAMLKAWIRDDARNFSDVESVWADYRTLPADARDQVREAVA
jgi:hypothetical protein